MLFLGASVLAAVTLGCRVAGVHVLDFFMTSAYYAQAPLTCLWCLSVVAVCIPLSYLLSLVLKGKKQRRRSIHFVKGKHNLYHPVARDHIQHRASGSFDVDALPSVWGVPLGLVVTAVSILLCMLWNKDQGVCASFALRS